MARQMSEAEKGLLECYQRLRAIVADSGAELPPFAQRNALKALAALWQIANGLDAAPEQLYDLGA